MSASTEKEKESTSIRLVVQRFRTARLLMDETHVVVAGHHQEEDGDDTASTPTNDFLIHPSLNSSTGLLVYISFAKTATKRKVLQAASVLLNLPLATTGAWGDGSDTMSVLDMATQQHKQHQQAEVAVMIVPQANLISKVKAQGRSIQYHGQIDKETGRELYEYFVDCIKATALQQQFECQGKPIPAWLQNEFGDAKATGNTSAPAPMDPSIPPDQFFRDASKYSSWDEQGLPLTDAQGEPLTKSATKKLRKVYESHKKRHEKYLLKQSKEGDEAAEATVVATNDSGPAETTTALKETTDIRSKLSELLAPSFLHVVSGSFGKRQGLEFMSDMGPFCHVVNL